MSYEIIDVEPNTPEWLEVRRTGICASETADIMHPGKAYGTPCTVYASKVLGWQKPANTPMRVGQLLEAAVAEEFHINHLQERIEHAGKLLKSKKHPWLLATPDYWVQFFGVEPGVLEIKTTRQQYAKDLPWAWVYQVQQQLLVTGLKRAVVAVGYVKDSTYKFFDEHGTLDGCTEPISRYQYFAVDANPRLQEEIIDTTGRFWREHVSAKTPPPALTQADLDLVHPHVR